MCSIIGYIGSNDAAPILVRALEKMEYRGYDSVGIATKTKNEINIKKGVGKVAEVKTNENLQQMAGKIGIGHTRWATHGGVTKQNAHPHYSNSSNVAIVHNGIIENFQELKADLVSDGYKFESETDTEVIVNLIQQNFEKTSDVKDAITKTISKLKGHYAFVAMFQDGTLAAARFHEPLIIGIEKDNYYISSDVLGFIEKTDDAIYIDNENFIIVNDSGLEIFNFEGEKVKSSITKVSKEFADVYKGDYAHFTLKEISEQPQTILKSANKKDIQKFVESIKNSDSLYITGSGSSYNAAEVTKYLMSKFTKTSITPIISSELPFSINNIGKNSTFIAISQSGESADVLHAIRIAKESNSKIFSIINHQNSSLSQESELTLGINCGPEIGGPATKRFTSQLAVLYQITNQLCDNCISTDWQKISDAFSYILDNDSKIKQIAKQLNEISDIYVLGRGIHFPIAKEAALKLKELTYIHAEGIAGGELKHGPLALMDSSVFVIIINPTDSTYGDTMNSANEIKARGAKIIGISNKNDSVYDYWIEIPEMDDSSYPLVEIIPIQLLSYYAALEKNTDPDYPRNLAKSVTVK